MAKKQHTQSRKKPERSIQTPFESFIERELEHYLVELVNADDAVKTLVVLGRIKQIGDTIDAAIETTGKEYQQTISVTFRRVR